MIFRKPFWKIRAELQWRWSLSSGYYDLCFLDKLWHTEALKLWTVWLGSNLSSVHLSLSHLFAIFILFGLLKLTTHQKTLLSLMVCPFLYDWYLIFCSDRSLVSFLTLEEKVLILLGLRVLMLLCDVFSALRVIAWRDKRALTRYLLSFMIINIESHKNH